MRRGAAIVVALLVGLGAPARGRADGATAAVDPAAPPWRASLLAAAGWKGTLGARLGLNPTSVAVVVGVRHRRVYRLSPRRILDGAAVQVGADVAYAVATARTAVHVEWQPLAVTRLRLAYETWLWTGVATGLGHGLVFAGADSPYGPAELERREGEEGTGLGHRLALQPTLEGKLGPVVGFVSPELGVWYIHGPSSYWLEPQSDTLVERGALDATVKVTSALLVEAWSAADGDGALRIGVLHETFHAVAASLTRQRAALLATFTLRRALGRLHRPTVAVSAGTNLRDRNRQGEPWLIAGVTSNF